MTGASNVDRDPRTMGAASRIKYFFREVVQNDRLFTLVVGAQGINMMEDYAGIVVLPVWPTYELAAANAQKDPHETPFEIGLTKFLDDYLPDMEQDGEGVAIFPVGTKIAVTMTPEEFIVRTGAEARRQGRADLSSLPGTLRTHLP